MTPPRPWLLPAPPETPGTGTWKAENNHSAEMAGAVEYAPVANGDVNREAVWTMCAYLEPERKCLNCPPRYIDPTHGSCVRACYAIAEETIQVARAALKGDTP